MQTSNTMKPTSEAPGSAAPTVWASARRALGGPRGFLILGLPVVAGGIALGWNWLTAVGLAPIILSLAPCAAMCAVGVCAMSRGGSSCAKQTTPENAVSAAPPRDRSVIEFSNS